MEYTDLSNLTFGKITAESEKEKLEKSEDYFISTLAYINAKSEERRKTFYVGQRGSGKSALLSKLSYEFQKDGKSIVLNITPQDFSYSLFKGRRHDYHDVRSVYASVWHYTLVVQLFKETIYYFKNNPNIKNNRVNVEILTKYLYGKGFQDTEDFENIFFTLLNEATFNKYTNKIRNIESDLQHGDKDLIRFLNLSEVRNEVTALQKISDSHPIYIFIDELDTGWDNSKEAQNFIYGLFYSVREIKKMRNVNVFVSLRTDMYNDLNSLLPDPEKMRDDIERFSWTEKTLRWLISSRISEYGKSEGLSKKTQDEAIREVFEEGVLSYIISRSLHRPREIIQFCNDSVNAVRNLIYETTVLPERISLDIVQSIEPKFSSNRFEDTCLEYQHQYPNLRKLLECFDQSPEYYIVETFENKLEVAMLQTLEKEPQTLWVKDYLDNPKKMMQILFEIGFIKLYSQKDEKYLAYYESSFINLDNVRQLKIHDVFVAALKCHS